MIHEEYEVREYHYVSPGYCTGECPPQHGPHLPAYESSAIRAEREAARRAEL